MTPKIELRELPGEYAVCKLPRETPIPAWADGEGFVSISRTPSELSIVCRAGRVPATVQASREWRCFEFVGPFAFDESGIATAVIGPLSEGGIGIFLVATFDTDYLLIQEKDVYAAKDALRRAGHALID
jgi:hypothetical protein